MVVEGLLPGPREQLLLAGSLWGLQPSSYRGLPAITRDGKVLEGSSPPTHTHTGTNMVSFAVPSRVGYLQIWATLSSPHRDSPLLENGDNVS